MIGAHSHCALDESGLSGITITLWRGGRATATLDVDQHQPFEVSACHQSRAKLELVASRPEI